MTSRRKMAAIYWSIIGGLGLAGFLYWFIAWHGIAYTDDAYVGGNQVYITPLHSGFVTSIHTDDTYLVKRSECLVELDRTDANIAFDRAKEELAETVRDVCEMFHQVFVYRSEIETRKAEFIVAAQDFEHRWGVLPESAVSLEDYEHAVAALRASYFNLETTESLYDKALSLVQGTTIEDHPLVKAASDRMRDAWVYLYRCNIYSPVDGLAAQRSIQVGMWIPAGTPLMSVIPLDQIWVNANFKETQLRHMRIGQRVKITSDLYGKGVVFHGKIVGLPGVAGNAVSLLPPQNLSGNWIKIVQRLPVRVELDPRELIAHPLRIGLSMEATVDLSEPGPLVQSSTAGSPLYETPIFEKEETGDREFISGVIRENLDPTLESYLGAALNIESTPLSMPPLVQSVLKIDAEMPLAPPLPPSMAEDEVAPQVIEPELLDAAREAIFPFRLISMCDAKVVPKEPVLVDMPSMDEMMKALEGFSLDALLREALAEDS
jgi:membrane fusion protein (multidrug efflux system)